MSKSASQEKIESLQKHLSDEKLARSIDEQRHKQEIGLEAQFRTTAWNELLKAFDDPDDREDNGLKELVRVLRWGLLSVQSLRGAPMSDTMRVGKSATSVECEDCRKLDDKTACLTCRGSGKVSVTLTSVEAAANAGTGKWMMRRWNARLLRLASDLDNELSGSEDRRPSVDKPRCRRRDCSEPDKRQPFGAKYCAFCARPMGEAA